jgi:hypothetical protein
MLMKSIKMQLNVILERKKIIITFFILFIFILINYFSNVFTYRGMDIIEMSHPMKILLLSEYSEFSFSFMEYYPLLVLLPAGFSYASDISSREIVFIQSRVGIKNYYLGKFITVFLTTFFVFTIPFFIEILLNCIAFPLQAAGDPMYTGIYEPVYMEAVRNYLLSELFILSGYLYAIVFTLVFGIVSGILAVFAMAISTFHIKYKILLFLPVYTLLYVLGMLEQIIPGVEISTTYRDYLRLFDSGPKNAIAYTVFILGLLFASIIIIVRKARKDSLG